MRHFLSLVLGDVVAFWFLYDVPSGTHYEAWSTEVLCALVLCVCGFLFSEAMIAAWHYVRA